MALDGAGKFPAPFLVGGELSETPGIAAGLAQKVENAKYPTSQKDARNGATGDLACGHGYLRGWGADVVGMFRLRREDRFAILPATLRMTGLLTQR